MRRECSGTTNRATKMDEWVLSESPYLRLLRDEKKIGDFKQKRGLGRAYSYHQAKGERNDNLNHKMKVSLTLELTCSF